MDVRVGLWRKLSTEELLLNCGVGEDSWESLRLQGDPTSPFWRKSTLGFLWREWCWSWNSSTLATSCEELTHWKRLWCWEGLGAGGEGDDRGWDSWMGSLIRWMQVWVNSRSWWWTGRPSVLRFMGSQRVRHDRTTELNWTELTWLLWASQSAQWLKNPPANAGGTKDTGLIPGLGKCPGLGNDNPLQYYCLENSMDRGPLVGYSSLGCKELDMTEDTHTYTHTHYTV